jgi:hypothetical protein
MKDAVTAAEQFLLPYLNEICPGLTLGQIGLVLAIMAAMLVGLVWATVKAVRFLNRREPVDGSIDPTDRASLR